MKRFIKKTLFLLAMVVAVAGCRNSIEMNNEKEGLGVSWDQLNSAPWVDVPKENFPEWMVIKINEYETWYDGKFANIVVKFYRGEWNGRVVYYIRDIFNSCSLCTVFYDNGKQVVSTVGDADSFLSTSKNWVVIYKLGESLVLDNI